MGFQEIFVRFLGFIPAPVMFGSLIDQSCRLWQKDDCTGDTTSCVEYDNTYFRCVSFQVNGNRQQFRNSLAEVLSCKFCEISKNTFSYRAPLVTAFHDSNSDA